MEYNFADDQITPKLGFSIYLYWAYIFCSKMEEISLKRQLRLIWACQCAYIGHMFTAWAQFRKSFPERGIFLKTENNYFKILSFLLHLFLNTRLARNELHALWSHFGILLNQRKGDTRMRHVSPTLRMAIRLNPEIFMSSTTLKERNANRY
mgnify:CR=1 FL=1